MKPVGEERVADQIRSLADQIGRDAFLDVCLNLMNGADRNLYVHELRSLTGHAWEPGDSVFNPQSWPDYWVRTWGGHEVCSMFGMNGPPKRSSPGSLTNIGAPAKCA